METEPDDAVAELANEARAFGIVMENIALRSYVVLDVLKAKGDWGLATPLLDTLAHIARIASAPSRQFSEEAGQAGRLRVVR